jgi:hypothetical protein
VQFADDLICAALRGESPPWPQLTVSGAEQALCRRAAFHGVEGLLHTEGKPRWPPAVVETLRERAVQLAMWELRHQQVLAETLSALDLEGIQPVLIKGTALAYGLYRDPSLRTRGDTDLLVPPAAKGTAQDVLLALGYRRNLGVSGEFISYQASYTREHPEGGAHTMDLHWKINNSELLSRLFGYEELRRQAQPLPRLCTHAIATSAVHSLLIACMHRCTHKRNPYHVNEVAYYDADRLIWLTDIDLLATSLDNAQWHEFVALAVAKGLAGACLDGMRAATACFHTAYPADVPAALEAAGTDEAASVYLGAGKLRQHWMDFRALGTPARQLLFLRESLVPPPAYMRQRFSQPEGSLLWLYLRRAAGGLIRPLAASRSAGRTGH